MASPRSASPRSEITALRLSAQRIAAPGDLRTPADVARWMLALQSQDLPGARWAIGLRLPGVTERAVEHALATGEIVRSWPTPNSPRSCCSRSG